MDALILQGVQIGGQRRHQGLAFPGDHFGDRAAVQNHPAHELDVVMTHSQHASSGLAADGEGVDEEVVERLARCQPFAELVGLASKLRVGHLLKVGLASVDGVDPGLHPPDVAGIRGAENARDEPLGAASEGVDSGGNNIEYGFQKFHGTKARLPWGHKSAILHGIQYHNGQ